MIRPTLALALACALLLPARAEAEPAVGVLSGTNVLAGFDTSAPGRVLSLRSITGLAAGERVLGLDFRHHPADAAKPPQLFALGVTRSGGNDDLRLYTVDPDTGVATLVSAAPITLTTPPDARYGVDFNPASDRLRVVVSDDHNLRLNPDTGGLSGTDPTIDAGLGVNAVAYDRVSVAPTIPQTTGVTTAYAIAGATGRLGTIGGPNGLPSANGGDFFDIGPLGVALDAGSGQDLDISPGGGAYMGGSAGGSHGLYAVDLATGTATPIGATAMPLTGLAILPAATISFDATAVGASESAGAATLALTRAGDTGPAVSATWSASNGPTGTVSFAAGETARTIGVPIAADTIDEPDEQVTVTLSQPSFHGALGTATATLTIADDDPAPDSSAPSVSVKGLPKAIAYAKLLARGVKPRVTPNEPAAIEATLLGTTKRARLSRLNLALASRVLPLAAGTRTAKLKPSRRALRRPGRKVKLRVQVIATDAAGNRTIERRTVRLKPR